MKSYWVKSPKWLKLLFPNYKWHYESSSKVIYLTFDDGPMLKSTDFILDSLRKYNAKATFFCIGENVRKYPQLADKIKKEEHSIGNHTQHHLNGWKTKTEAYIKDSLKGEETLNKYIKDSSHKLFRPPYGKCTRKQRKLLLQRGYKLIMWSVLSADFDKDISNDQCLQNIIKNTSNGSIVILHDSDKFIEKVKYVLPKVLSHFHELGYTFKRIDSSTQ